jgi:hypothetical protein
LARDDLTDPPLTNLTKRKGLHVKPSSQNSSIGNQLLDEYGRAEAAPLGTLADLRTKLGEYRAEVLNEAIEAARGEYLTDATGDETDEAYNRGVSDAIAAIGALLEGGAR